MKPYYEIPGKILKKLARWIYQSVVECEVAVLVLDSSTREAPPSGLTCRRLRSSDLPAIDEVFGKAVRDRFSRWLMDGATAVPPP